MNRNEAAVVLRDILERTGHADGQAIDEELVDRWWRSALISRSIDEANAVAAYWAEHWCTDHEHAPTPADFNDAHRYLRTRAAIAETKARLAAAIAPDRVFGPNRGS